MPISLNKIRGLRSASTKTGGISLNAIRKKKEERQNTPAYLSGSDYREQLLKPEDLRTPVDTSRYNVFGQGLLPRYEEDKPLKAIGKDIVNYGLGTIGRIVSAPQQAMMQTVTNTANVIEGKPLDFSQKTLREDILPPKYDKALRALAEKGTGGKLASEAIDILINAGLDPATYVGGGIVDDLAKSGMMGKASKPSTEFVKVVGDRQRAMFAKQTAKETAQETTKIEQVAGVEPTAKTQPISASIDGGKVNTPSAVEKAPTTSEVITTRSGKKVTPEQFDVEYRKSLPKDEVGLQKVITGLETKAAQTTDEKTLRKINLQLFAAKDELQKLSRFKENTINRSTMLTDEEKGFLPDDDFKYTPDESKTWEETAVMNVRNNPEFAKERILKSKQLDKIQEHEAAIIAKQLLEKARQTKDYKELSKWLSAVSAKTRESARALKAVDLAWDKTTPEAGIKRAQKIIDGVEDAIKKKDPERINKIDKGVQRIKDIVDDETLSPQQVVSRIKEIINPKSKRGQMTFEKLMEIINKGKSEGKTDYDAVRNLLKEKDKIPTLTNEEIAQIDGLYQKAKEYAPDSYENRMYIEKARKLVEDKIPTDLVDKYRALQRLSMIFNPKTLITRNPGGNILLMTLTQIKENTLGAFVDMLVSAIRGSERTTVFAPIEKAKATARGFTKGVKEWGKDIKYNVDTNPTHGQLELQKGKPFDTSHSGKITKYLNPVNRILNALDTIEKRLLQLGDRPFYEAAYASRIAELKKIKKVTELTDEMKLDAKAYALDKVFQRDSTLSQIFGGMKNPNIKNEKANIGFKVLVNTIMPFTQTPANVLDKMLEYSPAGLVKALAFAKKNGVFNQKYFIDNLSSGLTGTGILTLGYIMAQKGLIRTKASTSSKERAFEQVEGKGNYALKFGDSYYTIDWAQPVASVLLAGAEMFKGGQRGEDAFKKTLNSITEGGATFFNMSLLRNVSSLFGSGNNPAASLIKTLLGSTTQFTPTMGKQIAQLIDPYVRETYDPNMLKEQLNIIKSKIPGLSMTLPKKRDAMGKEVKAYQGRNNLLNVMLNPGFYTKESDDPAIKEIRRLYDIEKDTDLLPGKEALTTGKFRYNQKDYTMSAKEFEQFNKTYGDILQNGFTSNGIKYPGINTLINTPVYKKLSDKGKASRIKGIYDKAYEMAKKEFLKKRGVK